MSPTRQNRRFVASVRSKFYDSTSFALPRLELLEDRLNPAGMTNAIGSGFHLPIGPTPAVADVAIVDAELLSRIPESELRGSKVIAIDGHSDAIGQIDQALEGLENISVLRVISHGESGAFWLGGQRIDLEALRQNACELESWSRALSADADLLLYGCSVAATSDGLRFIENLADLTGADVAASTDITGPDGDTELERTTGSIEHTFKAGIKAWSDAHLNLAFTNLDKATFYAEQGNTFTLMSDLPGKPSFQLVSGQLPLGIVFDASGGYFWGTPTAASVGTYHLDLKATAGNFSEIQQFQLVVLPKPLGTSDKAPGQSLPVQANLGAFAALRQDGSISAWGESETGGTGAPTDKGYVKIFSNARAFLALKYDGSFITWGDKAFGGSFSSPGLGYTKIIANYRSFIAVKDNGEFTSVGFGSQSTFLPPTRAGFTQFAATGSGAFAALNQDGTISFWGVCVPIQNPAAQNDRFVSLYANNLNFAALRVDGSLATWQTSIGQQGNVPSEKGFVEIIPLGQAFAALKPDGSLAMSGSNTGWNVPAPTDSGYTKIVTIDGLQGQAFSGLKKDGSISVWGKVPSDYTIFPADGRYVQLNSAGGNIFALRKDGSVDTFIRYSSGGKESPKDKGYTRIFTNNVTFIGVKSDGSLTAWGYESGFSNLVPPSGKGFVDVVVGGESFSAIRTDGTVVSWGNFGDGRQPQPEGTGFSQLISNSYAYCAIKADGTIYVWGNARYGATGVPIGSGFVALASPLESAPYFSGTTESQLFAMAGSAIRYQIPAQGTAIPSFRISKGTLPAGITLDSKTGLISGLPLPGQSGPFNFSVMLDNGFGTATKDFSLAFTSAPNFTSASKWAITAGNSGSFRFTLGKTTAPFHFLLLGNNLALPKGLQWDSLTGTISGTPLPGQGGEYKFSVALTNWVSSFASQPFTLTINEAPQFKNLNSVEFYATQGNTFTIMPSGYPKPTLKITGGVLPKGVTLDLKTGILTGSPEPLTTGTYAISLSLSNGVGLPAKQTLTIVVRNAVSPNLDDQISPYLSNFTAYNYAALAALRDDGSIAAWGDPLNGGAGAPTGKGYIQIFSAGTGFAALKSDGSISAWGKPGLGLEKAPLGGGFTTIFSNNSAFAALRTDGSIAAWGDPLLGGSGAPSGGGFTQIVANDNGFCALKADGSLVFWGSNSAAFTSMPTDNGYVRLFSNNQAFAAWKSDGSIRAWGDPAHGGSNGPSDKGFLQVYSNGYGFAALRNDGAVYTWGNGSAAFGSISEPGYNRILPSTGAFLAIKSDGTTRSLSNQYYYDFDEKNVSEFFDYSFGAFIGINNDGQLFSNGTFTQPTPKESGIVSVRANSNAFAGLKKDGSIVTWGQAEYGGTGGPTDKGYVRIYSTTSAFAAVKADGSIFAWGSANLGGAGAPEGTGYNSFAWPLEQSPWFTYETKTKLTANINQAFSYTPPVRGLPAPTFALSQGSLPPGVSLNIQTGLLSGRPSKTGIYTFTLAASNGAGTPTLREFTIQVGSPVNDPPVGAEKTISQLEDQSYIFKESDFGFADPLDSPANSFASIRISTLPAKGSLTLNGKLVATYQFIPIADIRAGRLAYKPAADGVGDAYASFTFRNRDDGGTKSGGVDLAINSNRITFNVSPVNDAPSGSNKTLTANKTSSLILTLADFGFNDSKDPVPNALNRVQFVALPAPGRGQLTLNGVALKVNTFVSAVDIIAGKLKFTLPSTAKGKAFATFSFKVEDDGGIANGGKNLALSANLFTINVA